VTDQSTLAMKGIPARASRGASLGSTGRSGFPGLLATHCLRAISRGREE
jgi:hypothetical protein